MSCTHRSFTRVHSIRTRCKGECKGRKNYTILVYEEQLKRRHRQSSNIQLPNIPPLHKCKINIHIRRSDSYIVTRLLNHRHHLHKDPKLHFQMIQNALKRFWLSSRMPRWHVFRLLQKLQNKELEVDSFYTTPKHVFASPTINMVPSVRSEKGGKVPFVYSLQHRFCFLRRWRQSSVDLSETLGSKTHLSNYSDSQMISHCWHRKLIHNNLHHDRRLLQEIENVLDLLYPKATIHVNICPNGEKCGEGWRRYLHCNNSVIDYGFFCKEIGSDGSFILGAKFLVYLSPKVNGWTRHNTRHQKGMGTYWFIREVLPTLAY